MPCVQAGRQPTLTQAGRFGIDVRLVTDNDIGIGGLKHEETKNDLIAVHPLRLHQAGQIQMYHGQKATCIAAAGLTFHHLLGPKSKCQAHMFTLYGVNVSQGPM